MIDSSVLFDLSINHTFLETKVVPKNILSAKTAKMARKI
jgi:hypothetical protein